MMSQTIAALQGAAGFVVQARLADFARSRLREGLRVAGCVEEISGEAGSGCAGRTLRDLVTGRRYAIEQDLGSGSLACRLDSRGVAEACFDAMSAIERGCDVVVLAKFGKLEADRIGLVDAFAAAVSRGIPVVTAVAPHFSAAWALYAGDLAGYVEPKATALEAWWQQLDRDASGLASPPLSASSR